MGRTGRMLKRALLTGVLIALPGGVVFTTPQSASVSRAPDAHLATIEQYCAGCHSDRLKSGGVSFERLTPESIGERADVFEKAVRKLRGRLMPPPGNRQPDQHDVDSLVAWLETKLDAAGGEPVSDAQLGLPRRSRRAQAGHVPAQRLTRTEFGAAVNDLLGTELKADELLPAEIEVNGFENVAAALSVSPAFLDQYVAAA